MARMSTLSPHLIVPDGERAIAFYQVALGAELVHRHLEDGVVVHAQLRIGKAPFSLACERREWQNVAPTTLGGTSVVLTLEVDDADATGHRLEAAGAKVIFPIADQVYGKRQGRLVDPFGHMWIVSQPLPGT
jgi:PhnB protein